MIRVLARLVSRHVCLLKEEIHEKADPSPCQCQQVEQTISLSHSRSRVNASPPETQRLPASPWPDPSTQVLVVLFTELAQRRVQTLRKPGGNP